MDVSAVHVSPGAGAPPLCDQVEGWQSLLSSPLTSRMPHGAPCLWHGTGWPLSLGVSCLGAVLWTRAVMAGSGRVAAARAVYSLCVGRTGVSQIAGHLALKCP